MPFMRAPNCATGPHDEVLAGTRTSIVAVPERWVNWFTIRMSRPMFLQDLLGIEHPIIQAPMAGSQGSALAVAVSNAGGIGSLPCAMLGVDAIRREVAAIRAQSAQPFNVNFFC